MLNVGEKVKVKWGHEVDGKYVRKYNVVREGGFVFLDRKEGSAFKGDYRSIETLEEEIFRLMDNDEIIWVKVGDI